MKARWNSLEGTFSPGSFVTSQSDVISSSASKSYSESPSSHSYRISQYQVIKGSWSSDVTYLQSWANGRKS